MLLRFAGVRPILSRLHDHEGVGDRRRHWVSGYIGGTDLREHLVNFGKGPDPVFQGSLHGDRLAKAGTRNAQCVERDIAFIEIGNEFRSHPACAPSAQDHQSHGSGKDSFARTQGEVEHRLIARLGGAHDACLLLLDLARHECRDRGRNEGEGEHHGGG